MRLRAPTCRFFPRAGPTWWSGRHSLGSGPFDITGWRLRVGNVVAGGIRRAARGLSAGSVPCQLARINRPFETYILRTEETCMCGRPRLRLRKMESRPALPNPLAWPLPHHQRRTNQIRQSSKCTKSTYICTPPTNPKFDSLTLLRILRIWFRTETRNTSMSSRLRPLQLDTFPGKKDYVI